MATVMQCLLKKENVYTTRWVLTKKAKLGEKLIAQNMSDENTLEWCIDTVFDRIEIDERFVYHAIK